MIFFIKIITFLLVPFLLGFSLWYMYMKFRRTKPEEGSEEQFDIMIRRELLKFEEEDDDDLSPDDYERIRQIMKEVINKR